MCLPVTGVCAVGPVTIAADALHYENRTSSYLATGKARVVRDGISLLADSIIYNTVTNEMLAKGSVVLEKKGDTVRGSSIRINLDSETGELLQGDLFFRKNNVHIRSQKVVKTGEADYSLERGTFTTCDGDSPSWHFTASNLDVTLEDYATGRNALFYVGDIPLFYTPYIVFPVKVERQSGFLMPKIGNSTKKGFNLDIPYYVAISPSQDVTLDLDFQSKRGVGAGVDYRYKRRNLSEGALLAYGINDTTKDRFRGALNERQREELSDTLTLQSDVTLLSDRKFFRDYSEEAGDYNRQKVDSIVALSKRLESYWLGSEIRHTTDLEALSNRTTVQKLPAVTFNGVGEKLGETPLFFALESSLVNFQRQEGVSGQRVEIFPRLSLYSQVALLDLSLTAGYREHLYNASGADALNGFHQTGMAEAGATVSTLLARSYEADLGQLKRLRHLLVPELGFGFVQARNQDGLPKFDNNDRLPGQSMVTWSLTSYLTGKYQLGESAARNRELFFFKLSQGYQVSGSRRDLLTIVDDGRKWTDLRVEAKLTPFKEMTVSMDSRYNAYQQRFSTLSLLADYDDKAGNQAGIGYQMAYHDVEYLEGRLGVALVKPFVFNYTTRYSFDRKGILESRYALEYKRQCWSVIFSYRDRPDNREFMVSFALAGIGAVGPVKAF
jgi:LPS-assembly protein